MAIITPDHRISSGANTLKGIKSLWDFLDQAGNKQKRRRAPLKKKYSIPFNQCLSVAKINIWGLEIRCIPSRNCKFQEALFHLNGP